MKYILTDCNQEPSALNGGNMWRLTFYCVDDGTEHEMTVASNYDNFRRQGWDHVVRDPCPWGVYRDLKRTNRKTTRGLSVVTADSRAKCTMELESQELAQQLVQIDQDQRRGGNTFGDLFERE